MAAPSLTAAFWIICRNVHKKSLPNGVSAGKRYDVNIYKLLFVLFLCVILKEKRKGEGSYE